MRGGSGGRDSNRAAEAATGCHRPPQPATGCHRPENLLAPAAASQPAESSKIDSNHQKSVKIINKNMKIINYPGDVSQPMREGDG